MLPLRCNLHSHKTSKFMREPIWWIALADTAFVSLLNCRESFKCQTLFTLTASMDIFKEYNRTTVDGFNVTHPGSLSSLNWQRYTLYRSRREVQRGISRCTAGLELEGSGGNPYLTKPIPLFWLTFQIPEANNASNLRAYDIALTFPALML